MYPKALLETCSSRRHFTASTSGFELPFRKNCLPTDCKVSSTSYCKFYCLLSPCSKNRDYYLSAMKWGPWKRERVQSQSKLRTHKLGQEKKKIISSQLFLCTKPCFSRSSPVCSSFTSQQLLLPTSLGSWGENKALTGVLPCEGSDAESSSRGRRFLLGWGTALLSQLFVRGGGHQLPDEYSLQAAIVNALSQPSSTGKPATQPAQAQVSRRGRLPPSQSWRDRQLAPINTAHGQGILCSQKLVTNQSSAGSIACTTTEHP